MRGVTDLQTSVAMSRHRDQIAYYGQYSSTPAEVPERLARCSVLVIGVGGVGSELIRHLAAAGVGRIICVDSDEVEWSNLNRQCWFAPEDVGLPKVQCVATKLRTFAPDTKTISVRAFIDSTETLHAALAAVHADTSSVDLIACCADEPIGGIELVCLDAGREANRAVGVAGIRLRRGYWGLFGSPVSQRRARELFAAAQEVAEAERLRPVAASSSWTNAVISAFFAEEAIRLLAGFPTANTDCLCAFDFDGMRGQITADFRATAR